MESRQFMNSSTGSNWIETIWVSKTTKTKPLLPLNHLFTQHELFSKIDRLCSDHLLTDNVLWFRRDRAQRVAIRQCNTASFKWVINSSKTWLYLVISTYSNTFAFSFEFAPETNDQFRSFAKFYSRISFIFWKTWIHFSSLRFTAYFRCLQLWGRRHFFFGIFV